MVKKSADKQAGKFDFGMSDYPKTRGYRRNFKIAIETPDIFDPKFLAAAFLKMPLSDVVGVNATGSISDQLNLSVPHPENFRTEIEKINKGLQIFYATQLLERSLIEPLKNYASTVRMTEGLFNEMREAFKLLKRAENAWKLIGDRDQLAGDFGSQLKEITEELEQVRLKSGHRTFDVSCVMNNYQFQDQMMRRKGKSNENIHWPAWLFAHCADWLLKNLLPTTTVSSRGKVINHFLFSHKRKFAIAEPPDSALSISDVSRRKRDWSKKALPELSKHRIGENLDGIANDVRRSMGWQHSDTTKLFASFRELR